MKKRTGLLKKAAVGIGLLLLVICYSVSGAGKGGQVTLALSGAAAGSGALGGEAESGDSQSGTPEEAESGDSQSGVPGEAETGGGQAGAPGEAETGGGQAGAPGEARVSDGQAASGDLGNTGNPEAAEQSPQGEPGIFVHVCGAVREPGVYELEAGSRIYQAVEAAGGLSGTAAPDFVNMALVLQDGQQLRVPDQQEVQALQEELGPEAASRILQPAAAGGAGGTPAVSAGAGGAPAVSGGGGSASAPARVNLNTATKEELMTLSGIGEARAEAILAYREEHGAFRTIEDIMKISGIKEAAFQKIKDDITV